MEMILRIYPYHYFAVYKSIFISSCTVVFSFFKFSACPTSAKFQWLCPNHFQHTCALLLCQDSSLQSQGPVKAPGEGTSLGEVNLEGYRVTQIQENHIKDHQRPSFPGPNVWMSTCNKLKTTDSKKKWWLKECWRHPWSKQHQDHKPAFLRPLADVLWPGVARRSEPDFKAVRNRGHGSLGISSLTVQAHASDRNRLDTKRLSLWLSQHVHGSYETLAKWMLLPSCHPLLFVRCLSSMSWLRWNCFLNFNLLHCILQLHCLSFGHKTVKTRPTDPPKQLW